MIESKSRTVLVLLSSLGLVGALAVAGCDGAGDGTGGDNDSEVITTVALTFTPVGGGDAVMAAFTDPDGDGGVSGSSEPIVLTSGITYELGIAFTNELQDPVGDITAEIEDEAEAHQIFITGEGISGPAAGDDPAALLMQAYADTESRYGEDAEGDDLPVGLAHTVSTVAPGTGTFVVRLQHLPELNGSPQKTMGLAEQLAMGMALPGDTDASVEFELTVQ